MDIEEITQFIAHNFRSFGDGQKSNWNPVVNALKDEPPQFAAGVDIKDVVEAIMKESGFDDLLKLCEDALEFFVEWDVKNKVISGLSIQLRAAIAATKKQN